MLLFIRRSFHRYPDIIVLKYKDCRKYQDINVHSLIPIVQQRKGLPGFERYVFSKM